MPATNYFPDDDFFEDIDPDEASEEFFIGIMLDALGEEPQAAEHLKSFLDRCYDR